MFKKLGISRKKSKGDARRPSTESASSGGAAVPYSPTSPGPRNGTDMVNSTASLMGATSISTGSKRQSGPPGSPNGHAPIDEDAPMANAGGTVEEGRLLGEAAGKNDLDGLRQLLKQSIPVNTRDEVNTCLSKLP